MPLTLVTESGNFRPLQIVFISFSKPMLIPVACVMWDYWIKKQFQSKANHLLSSQSGGAQDGRFVWLGSSKQVWTYPGGGPRMVGPYLCMGSRSGSRWGPCMVDPHVVGWGWEVPCDLWLTNGSTDKSHMETPCEQTDTCDWKYCLPETSW